MPRVAWVAGWIAIQMAFSAAAATPAKPFIECNQQELVQAVPDLAGIQFDGNPDNQDELLRVTGQNLDGMFGRLMDLSAAEDLHEIRIEDTMAGTSRHETLRYVVKLLPPGAPQPFEETRVDAAGKALVQAGPIDFLVSGNFLKLVSYLLPAYRHEWRFRFMGRWKSGTDDCFIVAFAQRMRTDAAKPGTPLQGLAWIDAATARVIRLRVDLLGPVENSPFEDLSTDIALAPVNFQSIGTVLWLPAKVTVHARYTGGELHTVHRFSNYQSENGKVAGAKPASITDGEDAYELTARGIALVHDGKFSEAIPPLREALHRNPAIPAAHFNLASALRSTEDATGAEAELRETVKLAPDSGVAHNFLGILLSKRGDGPGALVEFRISTQVQPKQPAVHFNLAQALEKAGDRTAALQEYKAASELAPGNAVFKARYAQLEGAPSSPASASADTTIKVDVRQVLVPVIVTDKAGHHVTGLTRADFQVFEDGVEQKISAFSVEDAGRTAPPALASNSPAELGVTPAAPPAPKPPVTRRTYVICVDSVHSAVANLMAVRKALSKLFQSEQPGDAQYILLAIGTSMQLVQNTTTDPEKVLQAIESKNFQKLYLASRTSSNESDLTAFRRRLDEIRAACDAHLPECQFKTSLPMLATQIASEARVHNMAFLAEFRSMVEQLARGNDRRTVVLISDGFQLVPGKEAFELLLAYFPELRTEALAPVDRMPDLGPILRLAANRNVPIYTIDSRGLYTQSFFDASNPGGVARMMPAVLNIMNTNDSDAGDTLSEIAEATGGTAFRNSNDLFTGMQKAFADGRQYYMLAYVPANANADGKFRSISVRLKDGKMVVKAKKGYWAVPN